MKNIALTLSLIGLGLLAGGTLPAAFSQADPGHMNGSLKVGVVNLKRCFDENSYEFAKDTIADKKRMMELSLKELKDIEGKLKDLKDQMDGIKDKQSTLYLSKLTQFKMHETEMKYKREIVQQQYLERSSTLMLEVYNEIRRVLDKYAKDRKFDLIIRVEEPQLEEESPASVVERINHRVALYHSDAMDITTDFLKVLNAEYAQRKSSRGDRTPGECPTCKIKTTDVKCPKCGMDIPKGR